MAQKEETKLQNKILTRLRKRKVCFALRVNSGMIVTHQGGVQLAPKGMSDLILFFQWNVTVFVEVKLPGEKLRPKQEQFRKFINLLGFPYAIVESVEDVDRICDYYV